MLAALLLAAVLPVVPASASDSQSDVAVDLGDQAECQWLLTRLIDLDRCAETAAEVISSVSSPGAPLVTTADIPSVANVPPLSQGTSGPAEAESAPVTKPCPSYSVEQVLDAPFEDWDGDEISNVRELYNELDPCTFSALETAPFQDAVSGFDRASVAAQESDALPADSEAQESDVEQAADAAPIVPSCPAYTVNDVYADPTGDWDNDRASNLDEFNSNEDPCEFDEDATPSLATTDTVTVEGPCPAYSIEQVLEDPTGDWDRDRATNVDEFFNNGDPCQFDVDASEDVELLATAGGPCPAYSLSLVLEDPTGDWDRDQVSNVDEFYNQADPCVADASTGDLSTAAIPVAAGPCPVYSVDLVNADPMGDWDGDTATNSDEFYNSGDPCSYDADKASTETAEEEALRKLNEALNSGINAEQANDSGSGEPVVEVDPELVVTGEDGSDIDVDNASSDLSDGVESPQVDVTVGDSGSSSGPSINSGWLGAFSVLTVTDLAEGRGVAAVAGSSLSVQYVGVLGSDGTEFDSSWGRGAQPFDFIIGQSAVIAGWDEGLLGMRVGGRRLLQIPAIKAYGSQSVGSVIGPNSDLVFVVDLISVDGDDTTIEDTAGGTTTDDTTTGDTTRTPFEISLTGGEVSLDVSADGVLTMAGQSRQLSSISEITIYGSGHDDHVIINLSLNADIGVPVNFDATVGDDTVEILGAATSWTLASVSWVGGAIDFVSVENLVADSFGTDTLVGPDEDRTWSITGLGSGTVQGVKFSGFENLTGTSVATDTFEVTSTGAISGLIEGGAAGVDEIVIDVTSTGVTNTMTGDGAGHIDRPTGVINYSGIDRLIDLPTGNVVIGDGGVLSPGNSPGFEDTVNLDLAAGSMTIIEIDGNAGAGEDPDGHDQIRVSGNAHLGGKLQIEWGGTTPVVGDRYTFITFNSITPASDFTTFVGLDYGDGTYFRPVLDIVGGTYDIEVAELPGGLDINPGIADDDVYALISGKKVLDVGGVAIDTVSVAGDVALLGQTLKGTFTVADLDGGVQLTASDVTGNLNDDGATVASLDNGQFEAVIRTDAVFGSGSADLTIAPLGVNENVAFSFNSENLAKSGRDALGNEIAAAAGRGLALTLPDLTLTAGGVSVTGGYTVAAADDAVLIAATNVAATVQQGGEDLITLSDTSGLVVLRPDGVAGSLSTTASITPSNIDVSLDGEFDLEFNTTAAAVTRIATIGEQTVTLDNVAVGAHLKGDNVALNLFGQTLTSDLDFTVGTDREVTIGVSDATLAFGESDAASLTLAIANTSLTLGKTDGFGVYAYGNLDGTVTSSLPDVSVDGAFSFKLDTRPAEIITNAAGIDFIVYQRFDEVHSTWAEARTYRQGTRVLGSDDVSYRALTTHQTTTENDPAKTGASPVWEVVVPRAGEDPYAEWNFNGSYGAGDRVLATDGKAYVALSEHSTDAADADPAGGASPLWGEVQLTPGKAQLVVEVSSDGEAWTTLTAALADPAPLPGDTGASIVSQGALRSDGLGGELDEFQIIDGVVIDGTDGVNPDFGRPLRRFGFDVSSVADNIRFIRLAGNDTTTTEAISDEPDIVLNDSGNSVYDGFDLDSIGILDASNTIGLADPTKLTEARYPLLGPPDDRANDLGAGPDKLGSPTDAVTISADPFGFVFTADGSITVLGQTITSSTLSLEQLPDGSLRVAGLTGSTIEFTDTTGDVSAEIVTIPGAVGDAAESQITISPDGVTAQLAVELTTNINGATFDGVFALEIDTVSAESHFRLAATDATLTVDGLDVTGDFAIEKRNGSLQLTVANAALSMYVDPAADPQVELVGVSGASGSFIVSADGVAGFATGSLELNNDDLSITGAARIALNTTDAAQSFTAGGTTVAVPVGPFVRIEVLDASATLESAPNDDPATAVNNIALGGDFSFEQEGTVTKLGVNNLFVTFGDQGLQGGSGAFVFTTDGVAGQVVGIASVEGDGVSIGATFGLKVNTTATDINKLIVVGGTTFELIVPPRAFEFFASADVSLDLNEVGGFLTIVGDVGLTIGGGAQTISGTNILIFVGAGSATMADGVTPNPAASGLFITDATIDGVRNADGTFAVRATGNLSITGVAGISVSGADPVTVSFNNTGAAVTIGTVTVAEGGTVTSPGVINVTVAGQVLSGTFTFERTTTASGAAAVEMSVTGLTATITGAAGTVALTGTGSGAALLSTDGSAGSFEGTVVVTAGGDTLASLPGRIVFNTGAAVNETIGAETLDAPNGPFIEVQLGTADSPVALDIHGQTVSGIFRFEKNAAGDIAVNAEQVLIAFVDAADNTVVSLANGSGSLLIDTAGTSGSISGELAFDAQDGNAASGTFAASFNAATKTITASADDVTITVLGQTLSGDFDVVQTGTGGAVEVVITVTDAALSFGDGTTTFVSLGGVSGSVELTGTTTAATLTATSASVDLPGVSLVANPLNITVDADLLKVAATGDLTVAGQTITGGFTFVQTADGTSITFTNASLLMTLPSGTTVADVTGLSGTLLLTSEGVAASISAANASVTAPGFSLTAVTTPPDGPNPAIPAVVIDINTRSSRVDEAGIALPAGPYFRIATDLVSADITPPAAAASSIMARFTFEQSGAGADRVIAVGVSDLAATTDGVSLEQGSGAIVITEDGVAGFVTGVVGVAGGGFSLGGGVGLRFNTTGGAVDETVTVGGKNLVISFDHDQGELFALFGAGLSLKVGNFVTIEGDISFETGANGSSTFGANNALVFLGRGPLLTDANEANENPAATGVLLRDATIGVVRIDGANATYAISATGRIEVVGVDGVVVDGTATVIFNNTGAAATQTITFVNSQGLTENFVVDVADQARAFSAIDIKLDVLGQRLVGDFAFDVASTADGEEVTVGFENVDFALGDGTNNIVSVEDAEGAFLLNADGIAGSASTGTVTVDVGDGVAQTLGTSVELLINTTGEQVTRTLTPLAPAGAAAIEIDVEAGPFVRLSVEGASLDIAGQQLGGNFTFELATERTVVDGVETESTSVVLGVTQGTMVLGSDTDTVTVSAAEGLFVISNDGVAGSATATVRLSTAHASLLAPAPGSPATTFSLAINTTGEAVSRSLEVGGIVVNLDVQAGPFIRVAGENVLLEVNVSGTQTLSLGGNFAFEAGTDADGATVLAAAATNVKFTLGTGDLLTLDNGSGFFVLTQAGVAARGFADVTASPSTGVELAGTFGFEVNTTGQLVQQTFDVGGTEQPIDVDKGPFVQIIAISALILLAGVQLSAQKLALRKSAAGISITGQNAGFSVSAGDKHIIGVSKADFAFELMDDGIAGALRRGTVAGPDFGGDLTIEGVVEFDINTTTDAETVFVVDSSQDISTPALLATATEEIEVLAGTTIKVSGTDAATPAKIEIVGNELTASELLFTKVGNAVEIEGTNLGFSLQVGGTEVLGLTAGNFFLNIDDDGVVGGTTGGSISFTPDPDVSFTAAAVSLAVNTKLTAQSVDLDSDPLTAPTILPGAPLGSPFVRIEATAADLTILGSVLSADRFSFEKEGARIAVEGDNVDLVLKAGTTQVLAIADADLGLEFSSTGVAGAINNAAFTGPSLGNVSLDLTATASVRFNTGDLETSVMVGGVEVDLAAGSFFEAEIENAELTTDGVTLTADLLTFAQNDDVVEVTGTNIDFAISTAAADIVKVTDADFTARFTEAGLAAATTGGTIDFSGATAFDLAISGEVSVAINTTPDDATIVIVDDTLAVPTSTTVELLAGPYAQVAITNAVFSIEGSELTADRIAVTMTAGQVTAEGTNLDLLINAGATRVLGILDANFELVIQDAGAGSTAGIAGRLSNATILGPDLGDDFSIQGDVSVEFNTTDAIQTLGSGASIGTQPGGSYVAATLTPTAADPDAPLLTIAGVAIGADKVSFEYIASETTPTVNVAVDMLNVNFGDAVTVTADSASLTINGDGVTGTVQNVSIDVVTADDVGTDRAVAFTGNASLVIDTTASSPFVRAEIAGIDANTSAELLVAGQRLTGNYVIERFETLEGEEIVRVTATNAGLELTDTSGTVASITNGTGFLVITDLGIAGSMTVTADFGGTAANGEERFGLTVGKVEVEVNTTNVAVSQNVRVNGEMLDFELNAGPYVRVALTDAVLTVGLLAISGNLTFEQQGATAADTVTVVAFSSVSLEVDPTADPPNENTDKLAVTNARGAFIFDADGFAGLLSGDVEVAVEGFGLGGSVGLRINTRDTGITRTITAGGEVLEIAFTSDEVATVNAPFVDVFGGSVSLVIGDFVSIEADATWSADTLTATNVVLFVGSGPLFLEDDQGERTAEINPLAVGLRIFDADLKVTQSGDTYLMLAYGTLDLVGVQNADITGSVRLEINTTANDASVEVLDDTPAVRGSALIEAGVVRVIGTDLTVAVGSQEFSADLSFEKADDGTITVGVTNTTIILASGAFTLKQGEDQSGVLIFGSTGIAGSIEVAVEAGTNTTGLEFEANITAAFNSSSGPVSSPLLTAPLPAGPYVRAEITGIDGNLAKLTVSDQEFEGNFALEVIDSDPNGPTVRVVATGVTAKFGDGTNELISLINGSGYVIVKGSGVAVSVEGQIIVNDIEGVSFAGAFAVEVNTTGAAVNESFVLGDSTETLVLEDAEFVRIKGNDVSLTIAGQTISGSFVVETVEDTDTKTMVVAVAITDAQLRFSDGTTDFATATQTAGSTGLVLVRRDASSTAVAPVNQLAGSFAAKIVLSVPDVEFDVDIALSFNTSADAASATLDINDGIANNPIALSIAGGPFVKGVIGTTATPAKLTVEGQTIEGIFGVEVREDTNDASTVTISVNDAKLAFGPDPLAPLVTFEADEGLFIINDAGFAGSIESPPSRLLQTMWPSTAKPRSRSTPAMPKSRRCSKLAAKPPCSMFLQVLTSESTAPSTSMCLVKSSAVRLPSKLPATTFPSPQATCLQASVSVSQATSLTHSLG